ncbi:BrxA/BrxB family bacilliredoxin [Pseudogracilibacillus auburnensis]|uniref:Putative YphP/YqiW family bacilliredoxin n=1 Tax=Pseudogracilibacillus auburnensis TaxID=1494959 RepID=A0A2V3VYP2_9BACI|nr:BrxA/BrxB family bacilliredoxin [Pseudogracilibacillus auburnensis]MBO1004323.1 BrxA/BrxB family bacilliredoxin [Pseudogracilibacillus auburnensis]PXW85075.1 putative YphP/YqiW family bacilliredoxin [Pseudogracilibacillus auburnensis]
MSFNDFMVDVVNVAREDMRDAGYEEVTEADQVDEALTREGTTLVMINSVCGCAGGVARPAAANAIHYDKRPDHLVTIFAGQDREATEKARTYFEGYPPSSPSFAFLKDGKIVTMLERHDIEGSSPIDVINKLQQVFDEYCEEV